MSSGGTIVYLAVAVVVLAITLVASMTSKCAASARRTPVTIAGLMKAAASQQIGS